MIYTIDQHGDPLEKRFHPALSPFFPNYDEFWLGVVVPSTMRDVNGSIQLRPGADRDFELLVMSHYSCYCHFGIAYEILERVGADDLLYDDFFFHLRAGIEMVEKRFFTYCTKVFRKCGACQRGQAIEDVLGGEWASIKARLDTLAGEVVDYRDAITHDPRLGRIAFGNRHWIPKHDKLRNAQKSARVTLTWSEVYDLGWPTNFVDLNELAKGLMQAVLTTINACWPKLIARFHSLSSTASYQLVACTGPYQPSVVTVPAPTEIISLRSYAWSASGMVTLPESPSID